MEIRLTHIRLLVPNFAQCFRFYRDTLGFHPAWGDENGRYAEFDTGQVILALFDRSAMSAALGTGEKPLHSNAQDAHSLIFATPDVDAACRELAARGVTIETGPADHPDWGIRSAYFRDPAGNLIEINQQLEG